MNVRDKGTTIVLADAHNIVREGIRALVQSHRDLRVVGQAADGRDALRLVERHQPDILITDLAMPGLNGLELTRQVAADFPKTHVIILAARSEEHHVLSALKNGALAFVNKFSPAAELFQAIREVSKGRRFLKPLSARAIKRHLEDGEISPPDPFETLTRREAEILDQLIIGRTYAEIARELSISATTVATHRAHVMKKLGLHNRTELIHRAARRGILPTDD